MAKNHQNKDQKNIAIIDDLSLSKESECLNPFFSQACTIQRICLGGAYTEDNTLHNK